MHRRFWNGRDICTKKLFKTKYKKKKMRNTDRNHLFLKFIKLNINYHKHYAIIILLHYYINFTYALPETIFICIRKDPALKDSLVSWSTCCRSLYACVYILKISLHFYFKKPKLFPYIRSDLKSHKKKWIFNRLREKIRISNAR